MDILVFKCWHTIWFECFHLAFIISKPKGHISHFGQGIIESRISSLLH